MPPRRRTRRALRRDAPEEHAGVCGPSNSATRTRAKHQVEKKADCLITLARETTSPESQESNPEQPPLSELVFDGEDGAYAFMTMATSMTFDISKVKSLDFILSQNDWSSRQDDFYAMGLAAFAFGHNLDSLTFWIKGNTLFTHQNFILATGNMAFVMEKVEISKRHQQWQKLYSDKSSTGSLEENPPPIIISSKQMIDAVLKMKNIPKVRIEGAMETGLKEKIISTCQLPQNANQTKVSHSRCNESEQLEALQPASALCAVDTTLSTLASLGPHMCHLKGYVEALRRRLNFSVGDHDFAAPLRSHLQKSSAIADYLNLGLQEEELNKTVTESAAKIYSELVQESTSRLESPFMVDGIARTLGAHDPNDCSFLEALQYEIDGESSRKRKPEDSVDLETPKRRRTGGARVKVTGKPPKAAPDSPSPLKITKWAETPAQRAFERDPFEHLVLDTRHSDRLERGELGEMLRVCKHKSPFVWDGINCGRRNVRADQIAEGYMVDVQLGWKIISSQTKKDAYRIGRRDEVEGVERKPRASRTANRCSRRPGLRSGSGDGSVSSSPSGSANDGSNSSSGGNGNVECSSISSGNDQSDSKSDSQGMITPQSIEA